MSVDEDCSGANDDLDLDFDTAAKKAQEQVWSDQESFLGPDWKNLPKKYEVSHPAAQAAGQITDNLRQNGKYRQQFG